MITCVLFDLDGTLIDSWRLYMEAYTQTFEECYGRPFDRSETLELLGRRPRSETWLLHNLLGPAARLNAFELFLARYRSLHGSHFNGPYDGVVDMLRELRAHRYALGIVTGKSREAWTITGPRAGLPPFDVVVTESDIATPKPDPEGLLRALNLLGRDIAETLYIGDSLVDAEAARAIGMTFWAAAWPKAPDEKPSFAASVLAMGAARLLESPGEIVQALCLDSTDAVTNR
ncbi:MAG: HAD family hydrolase [Nitrospiraceae bacterium]